MEFVALFCAAKGLTVGQHPVKEIRSNVQESFIFSVVNSGLETVLYDTINLEDAVKWKYRCKN
jgi:hypothetical protein